MQRDHIVAHPTYLARLLDNLSRVGEEDKVRELYALGHHLAATALPDVEQANAWLNLENMMLIATCHLGHLEEAGMYRARIMEAGMLPSADAFATMIACSKDTTDDALVGRTLFSEALALGVQPNLFLYNTIISKLSRARKTEMALDLFKEMKSSGIKPSSVTYGAVIVSFCLPGSESS
jgi:pentatricopeptide repeat protein